VTFAVFITVIAGAADNDIVSEDVLVTAGPDGGVPCAVPVLEIDPEFTSACVVV
jgi:hypothetical protein